MKFNNSKLNYGLNGELAQVETGDRVFEYVYDVFGNLQGYGYPGRTIGYKVDGFDRRILKSINGTANEKRLMPI